MTEPLRQALREKVHEALSATLPITAIVLLLSIFIVPLEVGTVVMFLGGAIMLVLGMGLFQLGAEMSMTSLGDGIGVQLAKSRKIWVMMLLAVTIGVIITIAEPDLQVLANQVPSIPNLMLILTVAVGVGAFLALAVYRILRKFDLSWILIIMYLVLIGLSFLVPRQFLAVAFDSGGVTTGPITVPFIMAMGVGLSSMRGDKNASSDSFGLVALASGGPILAVLLVGFFYSASETSYTAAEVAHVVTMQDVTRAFAFEIPTYAREVLLSVLPILAVYVVFQFVSRRYQKRQRRRIAVGFAYTFLGLVLFLCGVNVGFAPAGTMLGRQLAAMRFKWLLIPIGMLIGYFIVRAEPAIQVLNKQVQSVTNGAVSRAAMNRCMSIGVSVSVGLAILRILAGIPIQFILIPGYVVALVMSKLVPKMFVGIAFDSGGVASGPMTSTFLLPLCIGACEALGGNIMTDAFGVVALVAFTPLIAIQLMGLRYGLRLKRLKKTAAVPAIEDDSDDIIVLTED